MHKVFLTDVKAAREVSHTNKKKDNNYLVKEAELIINNYIKDSRKLDLFKKEPVIKQRNGGNSNSLNIVINVVLVVSIALLLFVILKLI